MRQLLLCTLLLASSSLVALAQDESRTVGGSLNLAVVRDAAISVGAGATLIVTRGLDERVGQDHTLTVGRNQSVTVGSSQSVTVGRDHDLRARTIELTGQDEIVLRTGDAQIVMKKDGTILIRGRNITIDGATVDVRATKDVVLKGSKVGSN